MEPRITIRHDVYHHHEGDETGRKLDAILSMLRTIRREGITDMGIVGDKINALNTSVLALKDRVTQGVEGLRQQITELQARVDAGSASPEEIARLDEMKTLVDALDPTSPVTLPA